MASSTLPTPFTKFGFDPSYLPAFEEKLFIEGPLTARGLTNFFALLLFATVIATYGVLSNSTATVIGAMVVAPLMGPIMATTAAVIMGSFDRAIRSLALVLAGIITVIIASYILSLVVPDVTISFTDNGEITSRINPGLYALLTALGSGAAGAFITSRSELADSMGGVAIAISLVPPLCVVGIALEQGQMDAALGALLLFTTNFLAILLAGGLTLWLVGVGRVASTKAQRKVRRVGVALFVVAILLIAIPLTLSAYQTVLAAAENQKATSEVKAWLDGTTHRVVSIQVNGRTVVATIEGYGDLKPRQDLANQLARVLGHPVIVTVREVPAQEVSSSQP